MRLFGDALGTVEFNKQKGPRSKNYCQNMYIVRGQLALEINVRKQHN
jgi:hypothetical protein